MRPLPPGMKIELDLATRRTSHGALIGGSPRRMLRLSSAGRKALDELLSGHVESGAARLLGRRLVDAGIAHTQPKPSDPAGLVTVVVPVRDRPRQLARCLRALQPEVPVTVVDDGSRDPASIEAALQAHDPVRLIRRARCDGPAAARNASLRSVDSELIAFLDSDCVPSGDWLERLVGHFEDPTVGAVAPRVRPSSAPGTIGRYLASRSPLDMGRRAGAVRPGGRISYVPSAALIVRHAAIGEGFDEQLRYGEDVDLVWRMSQAGWTVRYDPSTIVAHDEPTGLRAMLLRRFHYGTSAAKLHTRHPRRLSAARLHATTIAGIGLLAAHRPRPATMLMTADALRSAIRARRRGMPVSLLLRWHAEANAKTLLALCSPAATLGLPLCVIACLCRKPQQLLFLLTLPALVEWRDRAPQLDPLRWIALATLDDIAYALGVWQGCVKARDGSALLPTLV